MRRMANDRTSPVDTAFTWIDFSKEKLQETWERAKQLIRESGEDPDEVVAEAARNIERYRFVSFPIPEDAFEDEGPYEPEASFHSPRSAVMCDALAKYDEQYEQELKAHVETRGQLRRAECVLSEIARELPSTDGLPIEDTEMPEIVSKLRCELEGARKKINELEAKLSSYVVELKAPFALGDSVYLATELLGVAKFHRCKVLAIWQDAKCASGWAVVASGMDYRADSGYFKLDTQL